MYRCRRYFSLRHASQALSRGPWNFRVVNATPRRVLETTSTSSRCLRKRIILMVASSQTKVSCLAASIFPLSPSSSLSSDILVQRVRAYETIILKRSWHRSRACWTRFQRSTLALVGMVVLRSVSCRHATSRLCTMGKDELRPYLRVDATMGAFALSMSLPW